MNNTKFIIEVTQKHGDCTNIRYYINTKYPELQWDMNDATKFNSLPDARAYINDNLKDLKAKNIIKTAIIKITETTIEQKNL